MFYLCHLWSQESSDLTVTLVSQAYVYVSSLLNHRRFCLLSVFGLVCLSRYTRIEEELNDIHYYAEEVEPGALDEGINRCFNIFNDDMSMLATDLCIFICSVSIAPLYFLQTNNSSCTCSLKRNLSQILKFGEFCSAHMDELCYYYDNNKENDSEIDEEIGHNDI